MGLGKRGALKRLKKLDADLEGRLLKPLGTQARPSGNGSQATKYLVCLPALREALDPATEDHSRELAELRAEVSEVKTRGVTQGCAPDASETLTAFV